MRITPATPVRAGQVVADVMIRFPKMYGEGTTVEQAREYLLDDHVHALLFVDDGLLVAVVEGADLAGAPAAEPVWRFGRLADRMVGAGEDLATVTREMIRCGRRRLAVVDEDGRVAGLLCRKRSGRGFCSDESVAARAAERGV
ncbi:MAG: CBS domain-containing protein [Pseudonocardia sp.]|nr:CBS domain-containing protein [Pseudonocardia sp.]